MAQGTGRTRQVLSRGVEISLVPLDSFDTHSTVKNLTGHGVEEQVTVVGDGRVGQGGDDTVKQVHHTTLGGERTTNTLMGGGGRVLTGEVHSVEHGLYTCRGTTKFTGVCLVRVEVTKLGFLNKDFLNVLAVV